MTIKSKETLAKALDDLQNLAKSAVQREESPAPMSAPVQLQHHANSLQPEWAGTKQEEVPNGGFDAALGDPGLAGMMARIISKMSKGQELSPGEKEVKDAISKAGKPFPKKDEADDDEEDDDDDDDMGKSLADSASDNADVRKGLEMSGFLKGWVATQAEALATTEKRISKSINGIRKSQDAFTADLAKSLEVLAGVLSVQQRRLDQLEAQPASAPRAAQAASFVEKSFGQPQPTESFSATIKTLSTMMEKGLVHPDELARFNSTNSISDDLKQRIQSFRKG